MPDSFSKTVPIWCCVINRVIQRAKRRKQSDDSEELDLEDWDGGFYTVQKYVAKNEREQIEGLIDGFVDKFEKTLPEYTSQLTDLISKPLRPIWISRESRIFALKIPWLYSSRLQKNQTSELIDNISHHHNKSEPSPRNSFRTCYNLPTDSSSDETTETEESLDEDCDELDIFTETEEFWDYDKLDFIPVILLNPSICCPDGKFRMDGFVYIQGAADDHELWGRGLTPTVFWNYLYELITVPPSQCNEALIKSLLASSPQTNQLQTTDDCGSLSTNKPNSYNWIGINKLIAIGSRTSGKPPECWETFTIVINCGAEQYDDMKQYQVGKRDNGDRGEMKRKYLYLRITEGKKGTGELYEMIPVVLKFLKDEVGEGDRILVHCAQGKDRSVGITLAILLNFTMNEERDISFGIRTNSTLITKEVVQRKLIYIQQFRSIANPSRTSLKKIYAYFIPDKKKIGL